MSHSVEGYCRQKLYNHSGQKAESEPGCVCCSGVFIHCGLRRGITARMSAIVNRRFESEYLKDLL